MQSPGILTIQSDDTHRQFCKHILLKLRVDEKTIFCLVASMPGSKIRFKN